MQTILFSTPLFVFPCIVLWLCQRSRLASRIGVVMLCYLFGLIAANVGLVPSAALDAQKLVSELSIGLALPMLLFAINIRQWRGQFAKALLAMLLAITATATLASTLFFLFREGNATQIAHFSAMSAGVYSGGTPNLAAIKSGLDIPHAQFILFHSLDTVVTALYLLIILSAVPFFRFFLGDGRRNTSASSIVSNDVNDGQLLQQDVQSVDSRLGTDFSSTVAAYAKPLLLSALVCAVSFWIASLAAKAASVENSSGLFIIVLTSLSLLLSFSSRVRALTLAHSAGMYLIYVFCFAIASMADLSTLVSVDMRMFLFLVYMVFGSLTLHAILCRLFKIDGDLFMVTSVAAICSPPFVPVIAKVLDNSQALLAGMTVGLLGYVIGNYLGIALGLYFLSVAA